MTVDEVLDELCAVCQLSKRVRVKLRALILTESERAAGVVDAARDHILQHRLGHKIAAALRECHDEILATSPGKGGG